MSSYKVEWLLVNEETQRCILKHDLHDVLSIAFYKVGHRKPWKFGQFNRTTGEKTLESFALQRELELRCREVARWPYWDQFVVPDAWFQRSNVKDWNE